MEFDVLKIILYIAIILLATKLLGMVTRGIGLPQVVGMVIAGLLIGPAISGIIRPTVAETDVLQTFSQIGVIFILFSSGLETDIKELKKSGGISAAIALAGVLVPIALGTLVAVLFMGGFPALSDKSKLLNALFVGCILSATSVGITVETLRELGRLNTKLGTTILGAAIIDDVLGIIALSLITSLNGGGNVWLTLLRAALFFVCSIAVGIVCRIFFKWEMAKYPHHRRTGIFAVAMCFVFAFCAERFFGIAAITGAYMAGVMLSGIGDTQYVDTKILVNGYMIFTPIFFAFIGISADFSGFKPSALVFGLVFVAVGILGKILGCGAAGRLAGYDRHESLSIGYGMIARGEVALAVYSTGKGLICTGEDGTVLGIDPLVGTIMLIVISSILCPILLKSSFRTKPGKIE